MNLRTRKITNVGVLTALSLILMILVKFPILPHAPYLLYDPGDIPILFISFIYGPIPALISTFISSILMAVITGQGGPYGALMHFVATGAFVGVAGLVYKLYHSKKGAATALISGAMAMTLIMIPANLLITPLYLGVSYQQVLALILPAIVPFNLIKSLVNAIITFFVYKKLINYLRDKGVVKK